MGRKSFGPKADGAWYLHKHTLKDKLESFVCYSSVATLFGNRGQANYAASNAFMDELCRGRTAAGMPSISVQWPAISGVGMAAAISERTKIHEDSSVGVATVKQVVRQVVAGSMPVEPVLTVLPIGMLIPQHRQQASMLEPLLHKFVEGLRVVDGQVHMKIQGTSDTVSLQVDLDTNFAPLSQPARNMSPEG